MGRSVLGREASRPLRHGRGDHPMSVSWLDSGVARRRARFRLAAAGLAASGLLAGCTQTGASGAAARAPAAGAATAHAENDASRDWRNATYTVTCDGIV